MKSLIILFVGLTTACTPPNWERVPRHWLDRETVLLEYRLGREHTLLRTVSRDSIAVYELPPQSEIEALVKKLTRRIASSRRGFAEGSFAAAATRLGEMLLGPVTARLEGRRLLIVPDGILHELPFGVLPLSGLGGAYEPLVLRSEPVVLPSIAALGVARATPARRTPASKTLAVIADPVFDRLDARLGGAAVRLFSAVVDRGARDPATDRLARLPHSRREAAAISTLVAANQRLRALGFDASRGLVESGELGRYRILHFATHGSSDRRRPELVLSRYDERGRPRDGVLRAREVSDLELSAELVVLSACQTAAGGAGDEGVLGFTEAFLRAGAAGVVASLWRIDDEATAELMIRFYRAMLGAGLPPAAALRRAQVSMWRDPVFAAPFYWAGFSFYGDWRIAIR